jgi:putative transposase
MKQMCHSKETCVFLVNYHVICPPKRRRKIPAGPAENTFGRTHPRDGTRAGVRDTGARNPVDHLYLFVSAAPQWAPNQIVARFKGRTSRISRQEFPLLERMPSLRTRSYFCSTAAHVSSDTICHYVEAQSTRD